MVASDPGRPRLTCYDDTPGPAQGERVELSARVLANWVAKAGNLLQDDLDGAPATTVGLDRPAHWRAFYWALAAWSCGATVVVGNGADTSDTVVTTDHHTAEKIRDALRARSVHAAAQALAHQAVDLATALRVLAKPEWRRAC